MGCPHLDAIEPQSKAFRKVFLELKVEDPGSAAIRPAAPRKDQHLPGIARSLTLGSESRVKTNTAWKRAKAAPGTGVSTARLHLPEVVRRHCPKAL